MKAVRVNEYGGPEALSYEDIEKPVPSNKEALVKINASGINYIDTYQRSGLYQVPLPTTLGLEAAGIIEEVGDEVSRYTTVSYTHLTLPTKREV